MSKMAQEAGKRMYEHIFIARSEYSQGQVEALVETLVSIIAGMGGSVEKKEYAGLRHLAYPIKGNERGHYVVMNILSSGDAVNEMERVERINSGILRFLTIKVLKFETGESALSRRVSDYSPIHRGNVSSGSGGGGDF